MRLVIVGTPPATNNLYAVVGGRMVLSARGRAFHAALAAVARRAGPAAPDERRYAVAITYHLGRDRDVEGSQKVVLDALSGLVWRDDRAIVVLRLAKRRVAPGTLPWTSVTIRPLSATAPAFHTPRVPAGGVGFGTTLLPPSTNNAMAVSGGRRRRTRAARQVALLHRAGIAAAAGPGEPWSGPVRVRIRYGFRADHRDLDGSHKAILDSATGTLWRDDRQLVSVSFAKGRLSTGEEPRVVFAAWALEAP